MVRHDKASVVNQVVKARLVALSNELFMNHGHGMACKTGMCGARFAAARAASHERSPTATNLTQVCEQVSFGGGVPYCVNAPLVFPISMECRVHDSNGS